MPTALLRFEDLKRLGIISGWSQLARFKKNLGFPEGFMLSENTRVYDAAEVDAWVARRRGRPLAPANASEAQAAA